MNIGIDLDGVIFDSEELLKCKAEFYDQKIGGIGVINQSEILCQNRYDWTIEQENDFLKLHLLDTLKNAPLKPLVRESLKSLRKNGHKLFVITSRGNIFKKEIQITKSRLKKEKLKFEKVVYSATDKSKICKDLKIDVMIDDNADNIISMANAGIKCLYFRDFVLKFIKHKKVIEVNNWGEIIRQIDLINKKYR